MSLQTTTRRSFVRRSLEALSAVWAPLGDSAVAASVPGQRLDAAVVLKDLSPLARTGFKGGETVAWLEGKGCTCPPAPNQAAVQPDGSLLARLSMGEFLLLGPLGGAASQVEALNSAWSIDEAGLCFQVPRRDSHAWFHLSGAKTPEMFAKLCGVDLRAKSFADLSVAQTSVARLSAIVIRDDRGGAVPAFHLLADSASAVYLWDVLLDAMAEFEGSVAGLG